VEIWADNVLNQCVESGRRPLEVTKYFLFAGWRGGQRYVWEIRLVITGGRHVICMVCTAHWLAPCNRAQWKYLVFSVWLCDGNYTAPFSSVKPSRDERMRGWKAIILHGVFVCLKWKKQMSREKREFFHIYLKEQKGDSWKFSSARVAREKCAKGRTTFF
jgi:hypothetical protein